MPALPTGSVRHFGAFHLVSQPPPGLSHSKPKGLVSVGLRRACHHHTLLDQVFVIDGETRIAKVVEAAAKSAGTPIRVTGFVRFALGEGIDRPTTDFAAEVGAQLAS